MTTGYKQTEVGVIPEDWDFVRLTTVAELESGHTPSRRQSRYWGGDIPWVSLHDTEDLNQKEIYITAQTVTQEGINNSSARLLPKGTVIFSRTATVGKTTVLGREMATSQDFANYICGPKVYNHFLVYLFRHMTTAWRKFMAGSIHNTVYMPVFRALRIPLPSRTEQQAIAEVLSDADALIESLEQLIAKKRHIKQGAMQELLTGKKRLPGFGGEWEVKQLGEIAHIKTGNRNNQDKVEDGEYPFFLRSATVERINSYSHDCEAILVPGEGDISGIFHYIYGRFDVHQRVYAITQFSPDVSGKYVHLYMTMNFGAHAMQNSVKATVDSLRLPTFQNFEVALPPTTEEQTAITAILSDMDAEIAALEAKLAKARQIKQGMMRELLTGRIRLV
ncbi:MAG TPA: restriction endonuclease subunit S [Candidatus Competibacter sp.]|nr:restriction endonuclease subunit S [Candidatus Competibacteraceae bacterium]HRW66004.1 restriction endonuclease subunit S [Candidatus Competibacter sp.]